MSLRRLPLRTATTVAAISKGQRGSIIQKVEEPNFFVFIADGDAERMELWWWRDKGPWNFMGRMDNVSAPRRIDYRDGVRWRAPHPPQ